MTCFCFPRLFLSLFLSLFSLRPLSHTLSHTLCTLLSLTSPGHTDSGERPIITAKFNLPAARAARLNCDDVAAAASSPVTTTTTTTGVTLFDQGFQTMSTVSPSDLRVHGETAFQCDLVGMSAQGTGPYRQVLTEMAEELHVPNLTELPLFLPNPNSQLTDTKAMNRNTIVPNPSAGATNALEMYEFFGRLIGIAIRNSSKGTVLPLYLTSTFWKQLSREKLTENDFKGIDEKMWKQLRDLDKCMLFFSFISQ